MGRIELDGLTRKYGDVVAVDGIDLDIADGEFLVLLGPSGCGKSTLLRLVAGLIPPTGGRVLLDGEDITHAAPARRDLAMVFQSYALYPHLTVARNIGFPLRAARLPRAQVRRRVAEVADLLELGALLDRRPRELSGGQRQRVAVGRAIIRDPRAFLMDEPLSNLDARLRQSTRAQFRTLHERLGTTVLYVTHDQVEALSLATRIAMLDGGRLEQVGTPTEIFDQPASVFVAGFLGSPPMNLLPARLENLDGRVRVRADGIEADLRPGEPDGSVEGVEARDVVFGVRPEHLRLTDGTGRAGTPVLRGVVRAVENLGAEEVAQCAVGGETVQFRGARPLGLAPGQPVQLATAPDHIHLFDRGSGRRLVWRPHPARTAPATPRA
ncbi:ABC transporter [Parafrankia colletiae]|uniref:ABC transporter n=1 Tax=Parafrankia colletiae TaxID=573497 RepID=A0A1S1QJ16_9ACTN|nr:ABC transporter ATP-binding protein [Parafrankia colletiae]MCK9902892.1 ABC transporter ATP-binding protein [Frankia sp. Cpl3]OHV33062.1 ABC transporter [Parafrankia colletiae]